MCKVSGDKPLTLSRFIKAMKQKVAFRRFLRSYACMKYKRKEGTEIGTRKN